MKVYVLMQCDDVAGVVTSKSEAEKWNKSVNNRQKRDYVGCTVDSVDNILKKQPKIKIWR